MNLDRFKPETERSMSHEKPESYPDDYKPQCECTQQFKPGDKVTYIGHAGGEQEQGIVKSLSEYCDIVFVVFKCGGDWEHFQNYTGAPTFVDNLKHGWM